jgi:hypothetical protein
MTDLSRIVFGTAVILALTVSATIFFVDFQSKNLTAANTYPVLGNSSTHLTELQTEFNDLREAGDAITGQTANLGTIVLDTFSGILAFAKIPITIGQIGASTISESLTLLGIPSSIADLIVACLLLFAFFALFKVVTRAPTV